MGVVDVIPHQDHPAILIHYLVGALPVGHGTGDDEGAGEVGAVVLEVAGTIPGGAGHIHVTLKLGVQHGLLVLAV